MTADRRKRARRAARQDESPLQTWLSRTGQRLISAIHIFLNVLSWHVFHTCPPAAEETAHWQRYRRGGVPGRGHTLRSGHDRFQLLTRLRPGAGGGGLFRLHHLQGSSSCRPSFEKNNKNKRSRSFCHLSVSQTSTDAFVFDRCQSQHGKTFLRLVHLSQIRLFLERWDVWRRRRYEEMRFLILIWPWCVQGLEFREFLLTKLINAELASYKSDRFARLEVQTQHFLWQNAFILWFLFCSCLHSETTRPDGGSILIHLAKDFKICVPPGCVFGPLLFPNLTPN